MNVSRQKRTITSLLKRLSEEHGIPLSTLKLNARILRELNLISFGSVKERRNAELEKLGDFILKLFNDESSKVKIHFSD